MLASTSPYRRELLSRLGLPFSVSAPDVDETPLEGESPARTAMRLAEAKARAVVGTAHLDALIIGSDQVAELDGQPIGKPFTHENAVRQLQLLRGRRVVFHTALALLDAATGKGTVQLVPTTVRFRSLTDEQIERYLQREQPYNCAGSAKSEGLGIAILDAIEGTDPNALVGLPLIALVSMLKAEGVEVL